MNAENKTPATAKSSAALTNSLLSSPPRLPPSRGKERRNPSITPRKFRRFFTPRSRVSSEPSAARRALRDLTAPALNRCQTPSSPLKPISESNVFDDGVQAGQASGRRLKRRKTQHTPETSPLQPSFLSSSPVLPDLSATRPALLSPLSSSLHDRRSSLDFEDFEDDDSEDELPFQQFPTKGPVPLTSRGMAGQLAQRMTGGMPGVGYRSMSCPVADWRTETADFCSKPGDVHMCSSHEGAARCIPFCATSCHSESLLSTRGHEFLKDKPLLTVSSR